MSSKSFKEPEVSQCSTCLFPGLELLCLVSVGWLLFFGSEYFIRVKFFSLSSSWSDHVIRTLLDTKSLKRLSALVDNLLAFSRNTGTTRFLRFENFSSDILAENMGHSWRMKSLDITNTSLRLRLISSSEAEVQKKKIVCKYAVKLYQIDYSWKKYIKTSSWFKKFQKTSRKNIILFIQNQHKITDKLHVFVTCVLVL